ncbi:outer membrane protein [Roseibium sp. M-1]
MVSSFANYDFSALHRARHRKGGRRSGLLRRILRSHWLLEPLVLLAVLGVLVVGANAADLNTYNEPVYAPEPQSLWAGPYLGLETGISQTATQVKSGGSKDDYSRVDAAFGVFGGYNWEVSRFVLGLEGSATYLGNLEKGTHPSLGTVETGSKWSVGAKARVGLPINNFMPYLSVGLAAADHTLKAKGTDRSSVSVSPVLGAGLEVAVTEAWHVRADYTLQGLASDTSKYGGTSAERTAANHRLMIGVSRSF